MNLNFILNENEDKKTYSNDISQTCNTGFRKVITVFSTLLAELTSFMREPKSQSRSNLSDNFRRYRHTYIAKICFG